jgi:dCTP diphosphatase
MSSSIQRLQEALREFAAARDWDQFHSPKNLAAALSVEAAELLEIFQWLTEAQSENLEPRQRDAAREELADVFLYLLRIADRLGVDLVEAADAKLARNAEKYPVDRARGRSDKYTDL